MTHYRGPFMGKIPIAPSVTEIRIPVHQATGLDNVLIATQTIGSEITELWNYSILSFLSFRLIDSIRIVKKEASHG